jgi:hypothetical protein
MYTLVENFCLGMRRLEIFGKAPASLRRGWVTVLAEGNSVNTHNLEVDGGSAPWDKESWENGIKALANGGKCVVPMTAEIDALRPKSPFRAAGGGLAGLTGGTAVGMAMGMGGARGGQLNAGGRSGFGNGVGHIPGGAFGQGQSQMMVPPMVGMGMGMVGVGEDGMVSGMSGWPGMMAIGNAGVQGMGTMGLPGMLGMGGPQGQMLLGGMGMGSGGGGFQGAGLDGGGFGLGGFNGGPGLGMGWPGVGGDVQGQQQFMENQGMWDGVDGMMGMGMDISGGMGMNGMGPMGGMGMGGMGMGQWGAGGVYEGY